MPDLSGFDFLKALRQRRHRYPSVLFLSGHLDSRSLPMITDLGGITLLEKPISIDKLFDTIIYQAVMSPFEGNRDFRSPIQTMVEINETILCESENLGHGGVFVKLENLPKEILESEDANVGFSVKIGLTDLDQVIHAMARIAWSRRQAEGQLPAGMALQFLKVANKDSLFLNEWVASNRVLSFIPAGFR